MNKFKKNSFLLLMFSLLIISQVYSAFTPTPGNSWEDKCYYKIEWTSANWNSVSKDWFEISCNSNLNFSSLPNWIWNTIWDWTYYIKFKWFDKTETWIPDSYNWETATTPSNKYWIQTFWPFKIDLTSPKCLLKEIRFKAWNSDNQYYNSWSFYYKKSSDAKGKFELVIESDDTTNGTNTSWIKEVQFPTVLSATPTTQSFASHTWKVLVTWLYSWSWLQNDTFDILNNSSKKFCFDNAWNSSVLSSDVNTKLIFEDWNQIITGISKLILTPDWIIPSIDWLALNNLSNWIKYQSWNDWNWILQSIYSDNSNTKYFAALENRKIVIPKFRDDWSWIKSFRIGIEKYNDKNNFALYTKTGSTKDTKLTLLTDLDIVHDFRNVDDDTNTNWYRNYSWNIETLNLWWNKVTEDNVCDMVWNCVVVPTPDFKVVANNPVITSNTSIWDALSGWTKHNLNDSYNWNDSSMRSNFFDTQISLVNFKDKYWNPILPVSGVKKINLNIAFNNTMWCNQISTIDREKWDCIDFSFKNDTSVLDWPTFWPGEFKNFWFNLTNANQFEDWKLVMEFKSAIPTKNEYVLKWSSGSLYWDFDVKLELKSLSIKISDVTGYNWVWESSWLEVATPWNRPNYKWNPVISFNDVSSIYPLVEWQQKELNINSEVKDNSRISFYNLNTNYWTNNFFLQFNNTMLSAWNLVTWNEKYDIIGSGLYWWLNWYWRIYKSTNVYTWPWTEITTPKTIWWIEWINTKIAYFANLNYFVWSKMPILPSIQTWFNNYWLHEIWDFSSTTNYSSDSDITFWEIDVRWIIQSNNLAWTSTWSWSVNTTNTFVDFSTIKLYDIKTEVSKNVEKLLAWKDKNSWKVVWWYTLANLSTFPTDKWINLQNWQVLYFKDTDVIIDCWLICNISWKKTLIIENWNLTIRSNMKYANSDSILGIILIWNTFNWSKSQVRISEDITNWVWVVYSDWPIVSVNSVWNIYDWWNTRNTNLVNQLYWKWSFATKNTVGWSIKDWKWVCPYGTPEYQNTSTCTIEKAQWYDLIYLRRYARVKQELYWINNDPMKFWDKKVPLNLDKKDIKTAWWDIFTMTTWTKTSWNLPKPDNYSSSEKARNSPLIIEYDDSLQTNPPIWFSK